jgi:hypothetical protein
VVCGNQAESFVYEGVEWLLAAFGFALGAGASMAGL